MAPSLGAILGGTTHFLTTSEAVLALLSSSIQLAAFLQKALVILLHAKFPLSHYLKVVVSRYKLDNSRAESTGTR